jgi:hypothetical protein
MKTQQSFVVKQVGLSVGQLTIFYTDDICTGGQLHMHQGTPFEERYAVFVKPAQTTFKISVDTSQFMKGLEQLDQLLMHLREGDDGMSKPARNFMEATLHEARALLHRLKKMVTRNV